MEAENDRTDGVHGSHEFGEVRDLRYRSCSAVQERAVGQVECQGVGEGQSGGRATRTPGTGIFDALDDSFVVSADQTYSCQVQNIV